MTELQQIPARVGVVGGGRMGAGIAQVFAILGSRVTLVETVDRDGAHRRLTDGLASAARNGSVDGTTIETVLERITIVPSAADLSEDLALVVEAVPELPALKIDVLTQVEKAVSASTIIASNTSSLSIAELALALETPGRFLGMHFFNPVPASALVEIVRAPNTSPDVVDAVRAWVPMLGKTEVVVNDSPGFATSRLGVCLGLEAIRMLEEGVADAASIDKAMELGYRHPMGPLKSGDLVGLDVRLAIAEYLASTLGDRFAPPQLLRDMVAQGDLGRKSGRGFYAYDSPAPRLAPN